MDKFDRQIIDLLRQNARLSITEISEQVSLSRSAVTARIKKLENDRVILAIMPILQHLKSRRFVLIWH